MDTLLGKMYLVGAALTLGCVIGLFGIDPPTRRREVPIALAAVILWPLAWLAFGVYALHVRRADS